MSFLEDSMLINQAKVTFHVGHIQSFKADNEFWLGNLQHIMATELKMLPTTEVSVSLLKYINQKIEQRTTMCKILKDVTISKPEEMKHAGFSLYRYLRYLNRCGYFSMKRIYKHLFRTKDKLKHLLTALPEPHNLRFTHDLLTYELNRYSQALGIHYTRMKHTNEGDWFLTPITCEDQLAEAKALIHNLTQIGGLDATHYSHQTLNLAKYYVEYRNDLGYYATDFRNKLLKHVEKVVKDLEDASGWTKAKTATSHSGIWFPFIFKTVDDEIISITIKGLVTFSMKLPGTDMFSSLAVAESVLAAGMGYIANYPDRWPTLTEATSADLLVELKYTEEFSNFADPAKFEEIVAHYLNNSKDIVETNMAATLKIT